MLGLVGFSRDGFGLAGSCFEKGGFMSVGVRNKPCQ